MQPDFTKLKPVETNTQPNFATLKPVLTVTTPKLESQPNYFQRVSNTYSKAGEDIISGIEQGASDIQKGNPFGQLRAGLRTVGGVAGAAFTPITELPIIRQGIGLIGKGITKLSETSPIKSVGKIFSPIAEFALKNPELGKDAQSIINIVSLGTGKLAEAPLATEAKLIGKDISSGVKTILTPSEEAIQSKIQSLFQKSIKPIGKKTDAQLKKYQNDTLDALKTIKQNSDSLNIEDSVGELVSGRTPLTINELSQAVEQTKKIVFSQYDNLAKQANKVGATIQTKPIAEEILKVADSKALQITNPEIVTYAKNWANRLDSLVSLDTETTQSVIQNMNNNLQAFYRNPSYDTASKVAIDAGIANNFRKALDKAIEGATGEKYQILKNQYGSLKSIENDVVRASVRDARKNVKGLLDYSDIFTGGQMLTGIMSLNPAMFTKGAVERGFKEYFKMLNDPNRAIKNIFDQLNIEPSKGFNPKSQFGKLVKPNKK